MSRRRLVRTTVVAVAAITAIGVAGGAASAAPSTGSASLIPPGTAYSLPGLQPAGIDILATTVRYDSAAGTVSATITLRGAPTPGPNGGPAYTVDLYGPGPQGSDTQLTLLSLGVPPTGSARLVTALGAADQVVPARAEFRGSVVVLTTSDARLKNLPLRAFQVTAITDGNGGVTSQLNVDSVGGRLG